MFISLNEGGNNNQSHGLILIFTEGTVIGPRRIWGFFNHKKYIPIKNCIMKIEKWHKQGWSISYLTSRKSAGQVGDIKNILETHGFPGGRLYFRGPKQKYKDIAEELVPRILIEDDCRSIGGKWQMTITQVRSDIKEKIKSIIVKEFKGIDHLPDNASELLK